MVAFLVIGTFVTFIVADVIFQWVQERRLIAAGAPGGLAHAGISLLQGASMSRQSPSAPVVVPEVPAWLFVDAGHTWLGLESSGTARLGLDRFANESLGRIDGVELPATGTRVRRGERLFTVRQGVREAIFRAPVDGVVERINESLAKDPAPMASDPYGAGWVCSIRPEGLARGLRRLRIAEDAREWLAQEVRRFREFISNHHAAMAAVPVLPDGGQPVPGVLEHMDDDTWAGFRREFLDL
jgi:glycine cleavage system H protein